ncbi:MAG: 6-carboxytetrahydropterin synthase QueD [Acidobacteria bacterium]|nr:MAG: 6-carboxytetrahydropterin synthase QueD [Acidobacteriota bacterium]
MHTSITKSFRFDASHLLEWHAGACANLHGHGYRVEVTVIGEPDDNGIVLDFDEIDQIVTSEVIEALDHTHLNDLIENPTAELIAAWIFEKLAKSLAGLAAVRIYESPDTWAEVRG